MIALTLIVASPVYAADGPELDARHEHIQEALDTVDATPEQREDVRSILETAGPQLRAFKDEGALLREDVHELFMADQIDRVALDDVRLDVVDLFDRFTSTAFSTLADLSEVFTPEQRQELRALRESRHQMLKDRWTQLKG